MNSLLAVARAANQTHHYTDNSMHLLRTHRTWRMTRHITAWAKKPRIEHFSRNLTCISDLFLGFRTFEYAIRLFGGIKTMNRLRIFDHYLYYFSVCHRSEINVCIKKDILVAPVFCPFSFEKNIWKVNALLKNWTKTNCIEERKRIEKKLYRRNHTTAKLNFPRNNIDSSDLARCNHRCYRKGVKTIFTLGTVQLQSRLRAILIRAPIWNATIFYISLVKNIVTSIQISAFFSFVCIWWAKCMSRSSQELSTYSEASTCVCVSEMWKKMNVFCLKCCILKIDVTCKMVIVEDNW